MKVTTRATATGDHARLTVWIDGQNVGTLTVGAADAADVEARLVAQVDLTAENIRGVGRAFREFDERNAALEAALRRQRHRCDALQRELGRGERFAIDLFRVDTGEELGRIHARAVPAPGDIVEMLLEEGSVAYRVTTSFGRRWVARAGDARASRVMLPVDRIMPWSFEPAIEPVGDLTRGPRPALRETDFDDPATVGGALDQARRLLERAAWLAAGVANGHPETAFAADAAAVARGATHLAGRADQVLDAADEVARRRDYDPIPFGAGEDG